MKNFDELLSDAELRELAREDDPTMNLRNPLQETTRPIRPVLGQVQPLNQKKKILLSRLKKKKTERLGAQSRIEPATHPVIDNQKRSPQGLSILDIYKNAGLDVEEKSFNVFRVESMFEDTSIIDLDERAKEAAIVMALKTHNIDMASVVEDGKDHLIALEAHDTRLKTELDALRMRLEEENSRLHAEIERYANPRLERMEANQTKIDELAKTYEGWCEQKEVEDRRLGKMVNRWTGKHAQVEVVSFQSHSPPGLAAKTKRATEPLPSFGGTVGCQEEGIEESSFLEPIVLEASDMESEVIKIREVDPDAHSLRTELSSSDLTTEMAVHGQEKKGRDIVFNGWMVLSVLLWLFGGLNLAIIIETMKPIAALGLALGIPVGIALFMGMISRGHGRWLGYMAFLGYCGIALSLIAHVDIDNLAKLLSQDPIWLTESSTFEGRSIILPEVLGKFLTALSNAYGDVLYASGLATRP